MNAVRVYVDPSRCQGHTLCTIPAPEIFVLDGDDGHAHIRPGHEIVAGSLSDAVRQAALGCPENAISFEDITLPSDHSIPGQDSVDRPL